MSKSSRLQSTHSDYEVGYGRPPVATRYAAGTSGNPRGRPKRKENPQDGGSHGELSMLHQAVLEAGAQMVEVKRGDRRVKVSAHAAVLGGLIEAARHGNTRAADMFLRYHKEAEEVAQSQSVEAEQSSEFTKKIVRLIWKERATAHENEELRARIAELEGRVVAPVVEPQFTEEAVGEFDPLSSGEVAAATQQVREVVHAPPVIDANSAPLPKTQRRRDDPVIPSQVLRFGGGFGISGGRGT